MGHSDLPSKVEQFFSPDGLPVSETLDELQKSLEEQRICALKAPPGSGKTILCPTALLCRLGYSRVFVLEPRRVTARLPALALREVLGELVGYRIRLEKLWHQEKTKLGYLTYGTALRTFLREPPKEKDLVIFDEFHERSWEAELLLAFLQSVESGPSLLLMSATLDLESLPAKLPVVESDGRLHPVTFGWEVQEPQLLGSAQKLADLVAERSAEMSKRHPGEQLIFLPGIREIRACHEKLLADHLSGPVDILHSTLDEKEINRVVERPADAGFRRILSTNLAESSVTLGGVKTVIDSGLTKRAYFDQLELGVVLHNERAPLSSLEQRAGRAGRLGPGHCHRLFSKADVVHRSHFQKPEIHQADYRTLVLFLASAKRLSDWQQLPWLCKPNLNKLLRAKDWCIETNLISKDCQLTVSGVEALRFPCGPRVAQFALRARRNGHPVEEVAEYCLALESSETGQSAISLERVTKTKKYRPPRGLQARIKAHLKETNPEDTGNLSEALIASFHDCIAQVSKDRAICQSSEQDALLFEADSESNYILVLATRPHGGKGPKQAVTLYHPISQELLWETQFDKLAENSSLKLDPQSGVVKQVTVTRLGQITLEKETTSATPGLETAKLLFERFEQQILTEKLLQLTRRLDLFLEHRPEQADSLEKLVSEGSGDLATRLAMHYLQTVDRWNKSSSDSMFAHINGMLPYSLKSELDQELPLTAELPRRRKPVPIRYPLDGPPVIESKLQDFFGWQLPKFLNGKVELQCHLLAPNGRACQITNDLESFWRGSYKQVRKDLRGRYPKHDWPEDPSQLK